MGLEEARDIVIIVYGALGVLLLVVLIVVALGLLLAVRRLTRTLIGLVDDPLRLPRDEVRQTVENVRGTSEFVTDTAVHPLIRVVSVGRGIRRGLGVVTGLRSRRR